MHCKRTFSALLALVLALTAAISIPVQTAAADATRLPNSAIAFGDDIIYDKFDALPMPNKGGFYYANAGAVWFCNPSAGTTRKVHAFTGNSAMACTYADTDTHKFYLLYTANSTGYLGTFDAATEQVTTKKIDDFLPSGCNPRSVGVDSQGRYYFSVQIYGDGDYMYLFDANFKQLDRYKSEDPMYDFCGFDKTNGNFYFTAYASVRSGFGSIVYRTLRCGRVVNNALSVNSAVLDTLYRTYLTDHYGNGTILANGDLAWTSTYNHTVSVLNSAAFDATQKKTDAQRGSLSRYGYEAEDYEDPDQVNTGQSVGTRVVYNAATADYLIYMNQNTITEYSSDMKPLASYKTQHPVFAMYNYGDRVLVIEKDADSNYYVQLLDWRAPTTVTLSATHAKIAVGSSRALSVSDDAGIGYTYTWTSSNTTVASVTKSGRVFGNLAGTATITAKAPNGKSASCQITVYADKEETAGEEQNWSGAASNNISANNYSRWSAVQSSYLTENSDHTLSRIEHTKSGVRIETYSADGKALQSTKTLANELPLFGGYFAGENNNYLVFGQTNPTESNSKEVVRVVKYTKDWNRVSDCKISGCNTTTPFIYSNSRMLELEGKLYIYTGHEMYADEDGLHHQANLLLTVNESTMQLTDAAYNVSNLSTGYVSHSFNQFIATDGSAIYRVDHSESNNMTIGGALLSVNGIALSKYNKADKSTAVKVVAPVEFDQNSNNYTGAAIGGFALGSGSSLIAYTQDVSTTSRVRNVKLSVTDTDFSTTKQIKLTNYGSSSKVSCRTPQLVKINENLFLLLWEEYNSSTDKVTTKTMTVTATGATVNSATVLPVRLSDCTPILCSDGMVKWYVTDNGAPRLYSVNPYDPVNYHLHSYTAAITQPATCTEPGVRTYTCSCGDSYTRTIPATGHNWNDGTVTKPATCTATGQALYTCKTCGDTRTAEVAKAAHKYRWVTKTRATATKDGAAVQTCTVCGSTGAKRTINKASSITLSAATYTYNGKVKTPTVTVKNSKGTKLTANTHYRVTQPAGRKNVGRYSVKIQLTGDYTGTVYRYFNIAPKGTGIKSLTAGKKAVTVKLNLQKTQTTGYQIQYGTAKNFKSAKTVNVSNKTSGKKLTKLSGGKRYYVRVRTYKVVKFGGKNYTIYSGWSSAKSVVTKK